MSDNGRLTERQQRLVPYLLASPWTEEACRRAKINKTTVYEWLKEEPFLNEIKRQRDAVIERTLDSLKANISKATETLVRLLDSDKETIQARAAEDIIEFTQKAIETEDLERRVTELEERLAKELGRGH